MRYINIDQYEFDDSSSEESLEINLSRRSHFPHTDLSAFVVSTVNLAAASSLDEPMPFYKTPSRSQVAEYLKRFANLDVPVHSDWPTYKLERESWDQVHLVICSPEFFIRYQWRTSA